MHSTLHVESIGEGQEIVILHGWGMNSSVFTQLHSSLSQYRVHYVDLPGFGHSEAIDGDLDTWVDAIVNQLPNKAIWIGWSLGGLVATKAALRFPQRVTGLVTIASSPCFMAREDEFWPGIFPTVLSSFSLQLQKNTGKTIERFLAIQAMGSSTAKEDIRQLKELVLSRPLPKNSALIQGLEMLASVDLRSQISQIEQPWLRIWGRLDGLVPRHVHPLIPKNQQHQDLLLHNASHAPFLSHKDEFLIGLTNWLNNFTD
ncbi:pimeloyl-ACP methyl ester esterase BioH [Shewanella sp. VB17]|uniref:pimeloyl-ACP methyl ester esterase BioH n=1 Tax=Shewanella sp. VB17 TaxID=2739432 RepID=UPI001564D64D|nr:pimeloyl-ACP methyl ester esterase BioH [Shewanella sp. VB17]NRD72260.1 pimeloyl-ACP methyl ester esterase BioH [Shewanella sp. VB17]